MFLQNNWAFKVLIHYGLVTPEILVNTGSGNGLLPDGTKPLPEPMLTSHQQDPLAFIPRLYLLNISIHTLYLKFISQPRLLGDNELKLYNQD